jgi:phage tail sheath protein FI
MLQSDVTTSAQEAWRFGGASRLLASILRTARAHGDHLAFEPNGTQTWARLRRSLEDLLLGYWREGAFAGANAAQAFQVRCDRSTMTQADLDAGRLIAEISVRPAQAIEVITVRLQLGNALGSTGLREAA